MNFHLALACLAAYAFMAGTSFAFALDRRRMIDWIQFGVFCFCAAAYIYIIVLRHGEMLK